MMSFISAIINTIITKADNLVFMTDLEVKGPWMQALVNQAKDIQGPLQRLIDHYQNAIDSGEILVGGGNIKAA